MLCPHCAGDETRVIDSRPDASGRVKRKRRCVSCGERFGTVEWISAEDLLIKKRNGRIEPFSRAKLTRAIIKGSSGQGISAADINAFVDRVAQILQPGVAGTPISSTEVDRVVLEQLQDSNPGTDVARVRYAIVFLGTSTRPGGFRGLQGFMEWLEDNYGPFVSDTPSTTPWSVIKRHGRVELYRLDKLEQSIYIAAKGRGTDDEVRALSREVARSVSSGLTGQALVTSQQIAAEALKFLRNRDAMTYLRYASAVKQYRSASDFWMDAVGLDVATGND